MIIEGGNSHEKQGGGRRREKENEEDEVKLENTTGIMRRFHERSMHGLNMRKSGMCGVLDAYVIMNWLVFKR